MDLFVASKLMVDLLLATSVIWVAVASAKRKNERIELISKEAKELESSLRKLIEDAEDSSIELNKELKRRQRDLEHVLFELETMEQKLNRINAQAQEHAEEISQRCKDARKILSKTPLSQKVEVVRDEEREDNSEEYGGEGVHDKGNSPSVNIYGEPIGQAWEQNRGEDNSGSEDYLNATRANSVSEEQKQEVMKIIETAKTLLRAGEDIADVAASTRLPIRTIRKIQNAVLKERDTMPVAEEQTSVIGRDPRLGVLGDMQRGVSTV
ncbi:MAG: hypothetical protein D6808_01665 [Candidatus Dadabacteria bacterium]|nr:MAG: hypothetical protein D6808_01665 [Candidatus Dadabacteria bacterium]